MARLTTDYVLAGEGRVALHERGENSRFLVAPEPDAEHVVLAPAGHLGRYDILHPKDRMLAGVVGRLDHDHDGCHGNIGQLIGVGSHS